MQLESRSKLVAAACGLTGAALAGLVLDALGSVRFSTLYANHLGSQAISQLRTNLLLSEIPTALSVGMACAFLGLLATVAPEVRRKDRLTHAAIAGLTWILVVRFLQTILLDLRVNLSSIAANLFWLVAWALSILAIAAFMFRAVRSDETERPVSAINGSPR